MPHTTVYYSFFCCGDNEFQATYCHGKLAEFCCTTCKSVFQVANNTEGEN